MVIEEFKSGSTLIRYDDRDIGTNESDIEVFNTLIGIILKKFQNI